MHSGQGGIMLKGDVYTKPMDLGQLFSYVHCKRTKCKHNDKGACTNKIIHVGACGCDDR